MNNIVASNEFRVTRQSKVPLVIFYSLLVTHNSEL